MLKLFCSLLFALQSPGLKLEGRVVDAAGAPVAAHVVVGSQPQTRRADHECLSATVAGADGRFALELPRAWIDRTSGYRRLSVFAYSEGHGIARQTWDLADVPAGTPFDLLLPPPTSARVRFVDPGGRPVSGARVWIQGLRDAESGPFSMPPAWWREHAAITDEEGWATLPAAHGELTYLGLEGGGFGRHVFGVDPGEMKPLPEELEVIPASERALEIEGPLPAGATLRVDAYTDHEGDEVRARYWVQFTWSGALDTGQPTTVLAPGPRSMIGVSTPDAEALAFGDALVGQEDWKLLRPASYRVSGRAVDRVSGAPVAGARLEVRAGWNCGWVTSGADGRFSFACGAQGFSVGDTRGPAGFADQSFLRPIGGQRPSDGSAVDIGDVSIPPTWTAAGSVRGPDDVPVASAWVTSRQQVPTEFGALWVTLSTLTDEQGRYVLNGAHRSVPLDVTARWGAVNAKARQDLDADLELTLGAKLHARGTMRTADGAGIADVELEVWRASPPRVIGGEDLVVLDGSRSFRTGADGEFTSGGGLEAEESYCLAWSHPRYEAGRSDWMTGAELARGVELTLRPLATVRGTLAFADGKPVAGARVRARRAAAETVTAADGSFELQDVAPDGDVVLASAPDGQSHVQWADPAAGPLAWTLQSMDTLQRPLEPASRAARERELEIAVDLLESDYRAALQSNDEAKLLRAVEPLAWADPALVLDRVESGLFQTPRRRDFALSYVAAALREHAPEEALAVGVRLERGMSRALATLETAARLDPAAEREQLAMIRAEARAIDPPEHRAVVLARLADRLLDLDERDAALDVLAEARELAEALPVDDWPGYARCCVGEVLARVDLEAGMALIQSLASAEDRNRHLFNVAHKLAASDPEACEALMRERTGKPGPWEPKRYASRIAHRMAAVDLPRARAIAAAHDRSGFADGMIALALCDSDPAEARASLATAFERAERLSQGESLDFFERAVPAAAALLPVVERGDPSRLRSYVARAVALRRPLRPNTFDGERFVWQQDAALAFYVARWEPELARRLLEPAVASASKSKGLEIDRDYDPVWAALTAVDPEWSLQVAREHGGRPATLIGRLLALPPAQRTTFVQDELLYLWVVGKEDI